MRQYEVRGRVLIVTGSSRGIGRAIALEAAKRGARGVVVNYRSDEEGAHRTIALLKSYGVDAIAVRADVGVWGEARRVIDEAIERYGGVDVLVNNAGILAPKPFREMEPREWEDMFRVHVFGSMNMARAALEYMREGVIVNIASILAVRPEAEASHYSAAKAALVAWTIALAKELAPAIRVFAVLPGGVDTRMARVWGDLDWVEEEIPAGRLADPGEVAKLVLDAVENPYVTGDILTISGALL